MEERREKKEEKEKRKKRRNDGKEKLESERISGVKALKKSMCILLWVLILTEVVSVNEGLGLLMRLSPRTVNSNLQCMPPKEANDDTTVCFY